MLHRVDFSTVLMCLSMVFCSTPAFPQSADQTGSESEPNAASLRQIIALLEDDVAQIEAERDRVTDALSAAQSELAEVSGELAGKRQERRTNLLIIAEIELTKRELETERAEAQGALVKQQSAVEALTAEITTRQSKNKQLLREIEDSTGRLEDLQAEIASAGEIAARTDAIRAEKAEVEASLAATIQSRSTRGARN